MKGLKGWIALMILLLALGAVLICLGLDEYQRSNRLPRGGESANNYCIARRNLS